MGQMESKQGNIPAPTQLGFCLNQIPLMLFVQFQFIIFIKKEKEVLLSLQKVN